MTIWVGDGEQWPVDRWRGRRAFESEYRRIYGLTIPDVAVEAVTWRLSAYADADTVEPTGRASAKRSRRAAPTVRTVAFDRMADAARHARLPAHRRSVAGSRFDGPAIVEERETTAVIRPGWTSRSPTTAR